MLLSLSELNDASNAVSAAQQKLQQVDKQLDAVRPVAAKYVTAAHAGVLS